MIIYIDISILVKNRANTGIQRVLKEFLQRAISKQYKIIAYNHQIKSMELLDNIEIPLFLYEMQDYQFKNTQAIDLNTLTPPKNSIFFDLDSVWYAPLPRATLYPILKENGFLIFNLIYDLVPIVRPELAHKNTIKNFTAFLKSVYQYSDMVFFDSLSAKNDFLKAQDTPRNIPTRVVGLGSDFLPIAKADNEPDTQPLLQKKYLLFVGTLEPRKNQTDLINAFTILANKYSDLDLILIGRKGWNVDSLIAKISNHPLNNKRLHWLNNIDDNTLKYYYKNAFIVCYLSQYEGYGLPIAESLQYGNITITSKNSAMYEVAKDFADYIEYNSSNEIVEIISLYYENNTLYQAKKAHIKRYYKPLLWDQFYQSIDDILQHFEDSLRLRQKHRKTLQFVFISIEPASIKGTLKAIDQYVDFVKEYLVITAPPLIPEFQALKTKHALTIIDEREILGEYADNFSQRDHVSKNWLLRTSLVNLKQLDHEFIMLDDDNRPLKPLTIDTFINQEGCYNCYYFYNLLDWNHKGTEYDIGQQNMKTVLGDKNYELLSYSSHAPQIINKTLFKEVIEQFFQTGLTQAIDEWSIYFNYVNSVYPYAFNKCIFQTLNWPDNPYHWDHIYPLETISFENYYPSVYKNKIFTETTCYQEKLNIKQLETAPFVHSQTMFKTNKKYLYTNNMVHGICSFINSDLEFYLSNVPYFVLVAPDSDIRLKLNYKLLNIKHNKLKLELVVFLNEQLRTRREIIGINGTNYQESIIEMPIVAGKLKEGHYNISFNLKINNTLLFTKASPYLIKLIVTKTNITKSNIEFKKIITHKPIITTRINTIDRLKQRIHKIPIMGLSLKWLYNHLTLNRIEQIVISNTAIINQLNAQLKQVQQINKQQQANINTLLRHNHQHHESKKQQKIETQALIEVSQQQNTHNKQQQSNIQKLEELSQQHNKINKEQQADIQTLLRHNHQHHETNKNQEAHIQTLLRHNHQHHETNKDQEAHIQTLLRHNHQHHETNKNQETHIQTLLRHNHQHHENNKNINHTIALKINKQLSKQILLFQQKIETFITQDSHNKKSSEPALLQKNIHSFVMNDYYLAFEETFRGSQETVLERYKAYLKYLNPDIKNALDIGCGRGEWTGLLQQNSIHAQGIDLNLAMLNAGTQKGIKNLQHINAFEFFKSCPDNQFDLVTAFHIIEHIPFEQLFVFLQEIKRISTADASLLLETPNPANLMVAAYTFYKDPTHLNPLPSEVVEFLLDYIGYTNIKIHYLHPAPEEDKIAEKSQLSNRFNSYFYREQDTLIIAQNDKPAQLEPSNDKPRLAYVSPLPPQNTGIAGYSDELLQLLIKYYKIDVINNDIQDYWLPIRTTTWLENNHNHYHRILYHFGNSGFHKDMIALQQQVSGVLVLHDFYLSNLMAKAKKINKNFIYQMHGYQALITLQKTTMAELVWQYPCNKEILENAKSIIVHSNYPKQLAEHWYQALNLKNWQSIPLLRMPLKPNTQQKPELKKALNLPVESFIVCCFGQIGKSKKNHELLAAWQSSSLYKKTNCYLIFVGASDQSDYEKILINNINNHKNIDRTGWIDHDTYHQYLSIADLAVQLRTLSRGESSAAILDCMNYSLPIISNANGSFAELPKETTWQLEDNFTTQALTTALETLHNNTKKREQLAHSAKQYLSQEHDPKQCAQDYYTAIEQSYKPYKSKVNKEDSQYYKSELINLSDFSSVKQQQILIDISSIIKKDLKTGIQRVVRSQIKALINNAPDNIRIEPIYLVGEHYHYARNYSTELIKLDNINLIDEPILVNPGDIFYGLDLNAKEVAQCLASGLYAHYTSLGVHFCFMIYDLLPISHPQFFPSYMEHTHTDWLNNIIKCANTLITISNSVAQEVKHYLQKNKANILPKTNIIPLHLGVDTHTAQKQKRKQSNKPINFLMVGTIEPRKAYIQTLAAFEQLWQNKALKNKKINLTIIGKTGWMMDDFIHTLNTHPELNKRLTVLENLSEQQLCKRYQRADCLIQASEAEGFGLPLIEAAQYRLPIIARDIPIFREVAGQYAYYFSDSQQVDILAQAIQQWLLLYNKQQQPQSDRMPYLSWQENAQQLLSIFKHESSD